MLGIRRSVAHEMACCCCYFPAEGFELTRLRNREQEISLSRSHTYIEHRAQHRVSLIGGHSFPSGFGAIATVGLRAVHAAANIQLKTAISGLYQGESFDLVGATWKYRYASTKWLDVIARVMLKY